MITDEIVKKIKKDLPRLTDLFSVNLSGAINNVKIENSKAIITLNKESNLITGDDVFLRDIKVPIKVKAITLIEDQDYDIEFETYHHFLVKKDKNIVLVNKINTKLNHEFELIDDLDGTRLRVRLNTITDPLDLTNITDTYLIKNHNKIINGYRKITVIDNKNFSVDVMENSEDYEYEIDIQPFFTECLSTSTISIGQRVFSCFDIENAIFGYCNLYNANIEQIQIGESEIKTKEENELTCYIELEKDIQNQSLSAGNCSGMQNYKFNVYIFFPLKKESQIEKKYTVIPKILTITNNVMNRILGNKQLDLDIGLVSKKTFAVQYFGCEETKYSNNVLYIHKISYGFLFNTYTEDFELKDDYFRLNRLMFNGCGETSIDIKY